MSDLDEAQTAADEMSDRSRKARRVHNQVLVPLKFDEEGQALTAETFDIRKHLKTLKQSDWRFLQAWRDAGWNVEKAQAATGFDAGKVKRLVAKLAVFRDEEARSVELAKIPTPAWIATKHVENFFDGGSLEDSQRDSLKELAKIAGAYKNTNTINIQNNVFNMPRLTPEAEKKLKEFADAQADVVEGEIAA